MAIRAAMIQFTGHRDKAVNVQVATTHIRQAAATGAQIICLQELFNTTYFPFEKSSHYFDLAEPIPGPTIDTMSRVAQDEQVVLVAPIYERGDDNILYNTAAVLGPSGDLLGIYRKSHIPMVQTPDLVGYEQYYFRPGNTGFVTFPTPFGITIGILICYDRHFPEGARALALQGADLVFVPTATCGMSRYLWETELRAHAIDNIYYVGGVNRVGKDIGGSPTQYYYGSSLFVDYRGQIISQADDRAACPIYAEIDLEPMRALRTEWGFFRDRRPDLYSGLAAH